MHLYLNYGHEHRDFAQWTTCGFSTVVAVLDDTHGSFKSFTDLSTQYSLPGFHIFHYHQLLTFLKTCFRLRQDSLQDSFIEVVHVCDPYSILGIYLRLIAHQRTKYHLPSFKSRISVLGNEHVPERILEGYQKVRSLVVCKSWR